MEEIHQEIIAMANLDQQLRHDPSLVWEEVERIDAIHSLRIKELISEYGWFTIGDHGVEVSSAAWLIVQHSLDYEFQNHCLNIMNELSVEDVDLKQLAMLTDRVMLREKGFQRYGTQSFVRDGYSVLAPLEDAGKLDDLRTEVGLSPIQAHKENLAREGVELRLNEGEDGEFTIGPIA